MQKWILRLVLVAIFCTCSVAISCNSGGGKGGGSGSKAGWIDANSDGIYDPYQDRDQWYQMMNAVKAARARGFSLVAVAHAGARVPWRDVNKNGIVDWAEVKSLWARACTAPWIDENGDGICDNYYLRPGGGWVYNGQGKGKWQLSDTTANANANANSAPQATFVVAMEGVPLDGGPLVGSPATGTAATWTVTGNDAHVGFKQYVGLRYKISFAGDVSGLPATVTVTVTWNKNQAQIFRWIDNVSSSGTHNLAIPISGGSVGLNGTAFATIQLPRLSWFDAVGPGSTLGTVTFSAPGVDTLTLTVVSGN